MAAEVASTGGTYRALFTAPWEPITVRRGDALGLRALADRLADAVAPDFSNRIRDGRWVTILAWCLCRSHAVFHRTGRRRVDSRLLERERYAWLRPLELLWVARTIRLLNDDWRDRPLAGQRRVTRWLEGDQVAPRFGMSPDQFRAYRQTGMYGAYRLAFRRWPGMTQRGDGWTPGKATVDLASWLERKLGPAKPVFHTDDIPASKWSIWRGNEATWWLERWREFDRGGLTADARTLPRPRNEFDLLPEATLLKPVVFGDDPRGKRRRLIAELLSHSKAGHHQDGVEHLARSIRNDNVIQLLPLFAQMADTGMMIMDTISATLRMEQHLRVNDLADRSDLRDLCKQLFEAVSAWRLRTIGAASIPHVDAGDTFAESITSGAPRECLAALLGHHERSGGGLRWFVLRNGEVQPRSIPLGGSTRYRFRLWQLCRVAVQCGVIRKMPPALLSDGEEDVEEAEDIEVAR